MNTVEQMQYYYKFIVILNYIFSQHARLISYTFSNLIT